ncbi:MAG: LamG-like jellyroll fold domain-containing protein, partial [bacterium]|nr:LamG-like jellyroll fold domain-containing protein [bacterium]
MNIKLFLFTLLFLLPPVSHADIVSGLLSHYKFDEGSGTTAGDSAGSFAGTLMNGPTWTTGKVGSGAIQFDGADDYIAFSNLKLSNQFTFSFWARTEGVAVSSPFSVMAGQWGTYISDCSQNASFLSVTTMVGGQENVGGSACARTGAWTHYAGTYNGSVARLYVNGAETGALNKTGTVNSNFLSFSIGRFSGGGYHFSGAVDDVRLYNRALFASEVTELYNLGTGGGGTTAGDTTAPSVPSGLSAAAVSTTAIDLSWTASTDAVGVTGYKIYRGGVQIGTSVTNSYSDTGLVASTFYSYTVSANDAAGNNSSQSSSASATTQTPPPSTPDTQAPSVPANVISSGSAYNQVSLSWSASTDTGGGVVAGYKIFRNGTQIGTAGVASYTDSTVSPSTSYSYTVSAYDNASPANNSAQSSAVSVTTSGAPVAGAGEDIYVANISQGANNGTSCANARDTVWLNAWNSIDGSTLAWSQVKATDGRVGPGDTLHLCGTIGKQLIVRGSGTSGNPITILFEPSAKISIDLAQPRQNEAINVSGRNWITIDGGSNGIIEALNNGTDSNKVGFNGITAESVSHLTVKNLTIRNIYVRNVTMPPWGRDNARLGGGISSSGSDISILNNSLSDADTLISSSCTSGTDRNLVIKNNKILRSNHGITLGSGGPSNCFLDNVIIADNIIDGEDTWENDSNPYYYDSQGVKVPTVSSGDIGIHRNGIIIFNESPTYGGGISNVKIYRNYINQGKYPKSEGAGTGAIFLISYKPAQAVNINIFNNLFKNVAPQHWGNGFIVTGGDGIFIANNTFVGWNVNGKTGGGSIAVSGRNIHIYNNLKYNAPGLALAYARVDPGPSPFGTMFSDYNLYSGSEDGAFGINPGGIYNTFAGWKAYSSNFDPHSKFALPLLDANYRPTASDTEARGKGMNLTSYCASLPELCKDYSGTPRPATGPWDIGAYEYYSGQPVTPPVVAPPVTTSPVVTPSVAPTPPPSQVSSPSTGNLGGQAPASSPTPSPVSSPLPTSNSQLPTSSFTLSLFKIGTGTGTVTSSVGGISCLPTQMSGGTCVSSSLPSGTSVTLPATPSTGSTFSGWVSGGCAGSAPCTRALTGNTSVNAIFMLLPS